MAFSAPEYNLSMTFLTTAGEKHCITVSGVKSNVTKAEVEELMNTYIANTKAIECPKGDLVSIYSAKVTESSKLAFDLTV